jgi:serine/threonine protein kinase
VPPHRNVVQILGVSIDGPEPIIVLEYCAGGSLDILLYRNKNIPISNKRKIDLVRGIASGMLHLHTHNIVHRDLAARNILLTQENENGEPKISDFGMSRILEKKDSGQTTSSVGPVCWMAPESVANGIYSKKSDVWSFGIVVYEIVARREPHYNMDLVTVAIEIKENGLTPKIPHDCPSTLRELMEMCWQKDPNQRPTFETICKMLE